ncbi:hypothetical protein BDV93DRAFT_610867 [Ceratobasidium sp. AG-I]|nr:hypothetical protein BDV93DRAFT_610867 [Ceratobasidium sp. AG-I]
MSTGPQMHDNILTALQEWVHARDHLSKAIYAYVSAATFLESICSPSTFKSLPEVPHTIEENLKILEREEPDLHRTQAALKNLRNSFVSPIYVLPSELLALIFYAASGDPSPAYEWPEHIRRDLSHVCSRWRQVTLEALPIWGRVSLTLEIDDTSKGKLITAKIGLHNTHRQDIHVPIHRSPRVGDTQYAQMTLDTIAPYIRQLSAITLNADDVEQLRPFLEFWLEKGALDSLSELNLWATKAALFFPETSSHLSDRLSRCLRPIEKLSLISVGLDWPSVTFNELTSMRLVDLSPVCCLSLVQLARILSTCPRLWSLLLERVAFSASFNTAPEPEPAEFENLNYLCLQEIDLPSVLPILSPENTVLSVKFLEVIDDADTLESLASFARKSSIDELDLTLLETRSDVTLARLLHPFSATFLGLQKLKLSNMNLRDSELNELATHFLAQNNAISPSASADTPDGATRLHSLTMLRCTIHTTPEAFHNAVSVLPWHRFELTSCYCAFTIQQEYGTTDMLEPINYTSNFGVRLRELLHNRPHSALISALQQWNDARGHLSKSIQAYVSAAMLLESMCTPLGVQSLPGGIISIESGLRSIKHDALLLPSEVLAIIFTAATIPTISAASPTYATSMPPYASPERYVKFYIQQVCSRWRRVAQEVCPIWVTCSLNLESSSASENKLAWSKLSLWGGPGGTSMKMQLPTQRQPAMDDASLVQATLDTVAPYTKQLRTIQVAVAAEQIQQVLECCLKREATESLVQIIILVNQTTPAFLDTNSHLGERLNHLLGSVEDLVPPPLGLDWSFVVFPKLVTMWLSNLPSACCPTLEQFALILSTCPDLQALCLEHITFPTSPNVMAIEPVKLDQLMGLSLRDIDVTRVLLIISLGSWGLHFSLRDIVVTTDVLQSLRLLAGRANVTELSFSLLETRSNIALAQLLSVANCIPDLKGVYLSNMNLRESELKAVAVQSLAQNNQLLPSASAGSPASLPHTINIKIEKCVIRTTPNGLHDAMSIFSWVTLTLIGCKYSTTIQGENGPTEVLEPIYLGSEYGSQLSDLAPDRTVHAS